MYKRLNVLNLCNLYYYFGAYIKSTIEAVIDKTYSVAALYLYFKRINLTFIFNHKTLNKLHCYEKK